MERAASFDYCYNHFQGFRERGAILALASGDELERSCLHLGFYLASWGMLRGSTELLQKSLRHFVPLLEVIAQTPEEDWAIDISGYTEDAIDRLMTLEQDVRAAVSGARPATDTLSTKIMLGVFGNVPAFDSFFQGWLPSIQLQSAGPAGHRAFLRGARGRLQDAPSHPGFSDGGSHHAPLSESQGDGHDLLYGRRRLILPRLTRLALRPLWVAEHETREGYLTQSGAEKASSMVFPPGEIISMALRASPGSDSPSEKVLALRVYPLATAQAAVGDSRPTSFMERAGPFVRLLGQVALRPIALR
ncbi:hypothetical protein CTI14_08155 [Methylobacterium radiotolerans]|nr:hypothetical protein CTI14_08155 [Methylobacterium radiotolerans]